MIFIYICIQKAFQIKDNSDSIKQNSNYPFLCIYYIVTLFDYNLIQKMPPTSQFPLQHLGPIQTNQQTSSSETHKQCRICLQERLPLIIACNCTGTVKYVHDQCLKQWAIEVIKKKIKEQEDEGYEDVIESIECELCKQNIQLKVEWTDKIISFEEAKLRNEEYFWHTFAINVFIVLVCLGCILFTLITMIMVLVKSPKVDYHKFLDEPLLSWGTLSVALASGIIFIIKAIKDLYGMFVEREFEIYGVIAKERIGELDGNMCQKISPNIKNVRSISDFKVNLEGSQSDLNKGFTTKSKQVLPSLYIEPPTNQEIMVPTRSIAGLKHLDSLPALKKFVQRV